MVGTFWAMREGLTLRPFGAESATAFGKLPFGKVIHVEAKRPRNGKQHRLFWTLVTRIADAIGAEPENVSDILKIKTGHCTRVQTKSGSFDLPKSISYAAMDQSAFDTFFQKCVLIIESEWGIARTDVLECVKDLLQEKTAA